MLSMPSVLADVFPRMIGLYKGQFARFPEHVADYLADLLAAPTPHSGAHMNGPPPLRRDEQLCARTGASHRECCRHDANTSQHETGSREFFPARAKRGARVVHRSRFLARGDDVNCGSVALFDIVNLCKHVSHEPRANARRHARRMPLFANGFSRYEKLSAEAHRCYRK